jgi:hypothetical protein
MGAGESPPGCKSMDTSEPKKNTTINHSNLYQYVFNNPFQYEDPDGQFAFVIPLLIWGGQFVLPTLTTIVTPVICGAVTGAIAYGGYKLASMINIKDLNAGSPNYTACFYATNISHYQQEMAKAKAQEKEKGTKSNEKRSPGNLQQQVEKGKSPRSVERVDKGRGKYEKDHVHFEDGSALNSDGTWKHGSKKLTRHEKEWLYKGGWKFPEG